jgi:hypothetical protein
MPEAGYNPPPEVEQDAAGALRVRFTGEDGRQAVFDLERIRLPGWRVPLAGSLAARIGASGGLRTLASAEGAWDTLVHFADYLTDLPDPPTDPAHLTLGHAKGFKNKLTLQSRSQPSSSGRFRMAGSILSAPPTGDLVDSAVLDCFMARVAKIAPRQGVGGYSDGELRRLLARLRQDAAHIRDRIEAGQSLAERFRTEPEAIGSPEREQAQTLAEIAQSGIVPLLGPARRNPGLRSELAGRLFLLQRDLTPLLALFVAVSDRNIETIKELPATCRRLSDDAIEVELVKRRRGPNRWFETVAWEVGPPGKELHHPGGLFLMIQRLARLSRGFSNAERLWAIWSSGHRRGTWKSTAEHIDAFADSLALPKPPSRWSDQHKDLWADPVPGQSERAPLHLNNQRLRKSIEVRRTRQMGGHLPSAARSNTYPVLFSDYLRADATARQWAEDVMAEALTDAEEAAWRAHRTALKRSGGHLRVVNGEPTADRLEQDAGINAPAARSIADGEQDTAFGACTDPDSHPDSGQPCRVPSLLDCFHCGNCLITRDHLPRLLALLDAFAQRRQQLSEGEWWRRYGPAWVAIRRDILDGRHFTPAEIEAAKHNQPDDALLDLVEHPWENTE